MKYDDGTTLKQSNFKGGKMGAEEERKSKDFFFLPPFFLLSYKAKEFSRMKGAGL